MSPIASLDLGLLVSEAHQIVWAKQGALWCIFA